ncbi:hypothetical protein [Marinobacter salicampi]|uniref:hypothetical protein n=1 Tax=Marinobacter salicampi TaxID=435907 RepID=UPI00140C1C0B|nr:hypothetical protein [Marinobacter salicampi]
MSRNRQFQLDPNTEEVVSEAIEAASKAPVAWAKILLCLMILLVMVLEPRAWAVGPAGIVGEGGDANAHRVIQSKTTSDSDSPLAMAADGSVEAEEWYEDDDGYRICADTEHDQTLLGIEDGCYLNLWNGSVYKAKRVADGITPQSFLDMALADKQAEVAGTRALAGEEGALTIYYTLPDSQD